MGPVNFESFSSLLSRNVFTTVMVVVVVVVVVMVAVALRQCNDNRVMVIAQRHGGENDDKHLRFTQVIDLMSVNRMDQERKMCWKRDD